MINIIKTAIITIIISVISGLLLDYYKNRAPKIVCKIKRAKPLKINGKGICNYIFTIRNISNKTIHDINVTAQGIKNNFKVGNSKITRGLKFDSSIENNNLEVAIPFLSKNDEFSVTLHIEEFNGEYNKPIIAIRSPEKFKRVNIEEEKSIFRESKNENNSLSKLIKKDKKGNKFRVSKKVIIVVTTIILAICLGVLEKGYFSGMNNPQDTNQNSTVKEQPIDEKREEEGNTKSADKDVTKGETSKKSSSRIKSSINTKEATEDKDDYKKENITKQNTNEKVPEKKESEDKTEKNKNTENSTTVTNENSDNKQEKSSKDETKSTNENTENVNK